MLSCQRDQFSLPADLHYLNCAYMAPLSRAVEAAGIAGVQRKRDPSQVHAEDFFTDSHALRSAFAALIGVPDAARIAIIPSVSYGIATAARNLPLRRGQNVVLLHEQFPSNVYAWQRLASEQGAEVRAVRPPDEARRGARWNERVLEQIDGRTAVVALPHVHWADGTRFDLEAIGERAREVGAALVVDGTQSVGALPFDAGRIRPDVLLCAGYKWLLGPYSLGLAYFGPRFDDGTPVEENWITRRNSEQFSRLVDYEAGYEPGAIRYDVGERSNFILVPMLRAALDHLHTWGVPAIQQYCQALTRDLLRDLRALGYRVEDEPWRGSHLFGIRLPAHVAADQLQKALAERNVSVSVRGAAVRVAPHVYNDADDVDALRDAFAACAP